MAGHDTRGDLCIFLVVGHGMGIPREFYASLRQKYVVQRAGLRDFVLGLGVKSRISAC